MHLAQKLKILRLKLNISQATFGRKLGITGKAVSSYETGRCTPPYYVLERISDCYDVDIVERPEKQKKIILQKIESFELALKDLKNVLYETSSL